MSDGPPAMREGGFVGTGGPDRRAYLEGSECCVRSDPRDAGEVSAQ